MGEGRWREDIGVRIDGLCGLILLEFGMGVEMFFLSVLVMR